ncbi:HDOD domain-containing protein [Pseudodesulfovibrio indicus]|uniref:EAL and HDOD domain-containing protein n=1 Tax=Pseudodesulfovibrio indicus TaxID=1716143 RepID=UPI00292D7F9E|nr:HDOD domain-containing protein [Pseudodesulfovibrio indicus]
MAPHKIIPLFEAVFIARQPIFRPDESVWGYELLFRSGETNVAQIDDEALATASVVADGLVLATEGMDANARVLINFPEKLLTEDGGFALPKDRCVIEILENVRPGAEALAAVRRLKDAGYTIAVDDYFGQKDLLPFVEMADIIKLDILAMDNDMDRVERALRSLPAGVIPLAEKVEQNETFHQLRDMGFALFQGFFFSQPEIIPGRKLSISETTKLQLLAELSKTELDSYKLGIILQSDPSLTYRLFRYVNSAGMGLKEKVKSAKRAIDMIGMIHVKQWLRSALIADLNPSPKAGELAYLAVHRAKFLESICSSSNRTHCEPDTLFMTGLFSLLDAMLGQEMQAILDLLPLEESVTKALRGEGEHYDLLRLATSYERGQWGETAQRLKRLGLDSFQAELLYLQARSWAQKMLGYSKAE